ncbi:transcriptional regulator, partial [Streptomyces lunaelactis]|nr:transcriptional regulator [Streptomyces lunaelactis]
GDRRAAVRWYKEPATRRRGRYVLHQLDVTAVARLGSDFLETVLR